MSCTRTCRQIGSTSFEDPPLLGPTAFLFGGLLVQIVERADGVAIGRALVMLFGGGVGAVEDPAAFVDGFRSRLRERPIGIAAQRQATQASVMPIEEHPGFVPVRRDADRETGRQRVEDLVAFRLRFERFDAPNGQGLHRHDGPPARCAGDGRRGNTGVTRRRRFPATTRDTTCASNPSTRRELGPNRKVQKIAGKRVGKILGAGGRWFESSRPDHF